MGWCGCNKGCKSESFLVMLRKADDAPRHKTVVSVLGLLFCALCQSPVRHSETFSTKVR